MATPFQNLYNLRKVSEDAAKSCDVCYKLSSSVLITLDNKDFFYVCPGHLKDRNFCTPKIDEAAVKAKRDKALAEETEKLKKEYEEKQRKKKEKEKEKDKDKDKKDEEEAEEKHKSKDDADSKNVESPAEEPRQFELKPAMFQQRIMNKRRAETAKRDRERVSKPNYFPSVPTEPPSK